MFESTDFAHDDTHAAIHTLITDHPASPEQAAEAIRGWIRWTQIWTENVHVQVGSDGEIVITGTTLGKTLTFNTQQILQHSYH